MTRAVIFTDDGWYEFHSWLESDLKMYGRLSELIDECRRTPREGRGKPERLRHQKGELWSRRLDEKNRIRYGFTELELFVLRCRGHYNDK
jgi:toxin YoeB